jgi:hypothetical protein
MCKDPEHEEDQLTKVTRADEWWKMWDYTPVCLEHDPWCLQAIGESDCLDEPETDESSDDCAEIIEDTKLRHFSAILQEAQRLAIRVQRDTRATQKQRSQYTRTSRESLRRQKKAREDLASKGFLPLREFMLKKQEKDIRLCTGTDVEPVLSKTDLRRRVAAAESESLVWEP